MSPETVKAYRIGLECYISYLEDTRGTRRQDVAFGCFDGAAVQGYAAWLTATRDYAPKTVELRLTAVTSFLKYSAARDVTLMALYQAARMVRPPRAPRKPVEYMQPGATAAVLRAFDGRTAKSRRNRMMLIFLYDSAARVSELAGTTIGDVHADDGPFVSLTGKGRKTRNMPLMGETIAHLRVYLDEFHPADRARVPGTPLFYSVRAGRPQPLSTDSISQILKRAADTARLDCPEVPGRVHCHLIRKTRAMDLYRDGVPLALIMQMLGHESMATTSGFYAFATMDMMAKAIQAANPPAVGEPAAWKDQAVIDALYEL
jgi:site-specific recombinase XerD